MNASRYVFYLGGPQAVVTDYAFWRAARTHTWGCMVAREAGVKVPQDTYSWADSAHSQYVHGTWTGRALRRFGTNDTALLPLEV